MPPKRILSLREQIRRHTEHLEELVASRTQELLEAHRVAVVGETVACMAHAVENLAAALEGSLFVLKQGMECGNREYLDDGWAVFCSKKTFRGCATSSCTCCISGSKTELRQCLVDPVQPVRHVVKRLEGRAASLSIALPVSGCRRLQTPSLWMPGHASEKAACSIWWATRWRPSPRRGCAPAPPKSGSRSPARPTPSSTTCGTTARG